MKGIRPSAGMTLLFWLMLTISSSASRAGVQHLSAANGRAANTPADRWGSPVLRKVRAAGEVPAVEQVGDTQLTNRSSSAAYSDAESSVLESAPDTSSATPASSPPDPHPSIVCPNCSCVPYYLCAKLPGEQHDPEAPLPVRLLDDPACPQFVHVLCEIPSEEETLHSEPRTGVGADDSLSACGRRNERGIGLPLEGFKDKEAQFGEFTWMAIILHDEVMAFGMVMKRFICGGSLIHRQVVMTAAHCVVGKNVSSLSVRLGDWDTQTEFEPLPHEEHRVVRVKRHGRFHRINLRNDIALLFLEEPVELKQHIGTLCLPEDGEDFDHTSCVATGFGKDRFHGGRFQNVMKQVDLPVVPHSTCQSRLSSTRLGRWFRLHPSFTCAGGEAGVDTCVGDGGSALACPSKEDPSKYVQAGIVAWGIGCGEEGVPGVYTSVPKLVGWIHAEIDKYFRMD